MKSNESVKPWIRRELNVAFSRKGQPLWFRFIKWAVILFTAWNYWQAPYFGVCIAAAFLLGLALHLFWRYKTKGWTKAWGGWDDLDSANK